MSGMPSIRAIDAFRSAIPLHPLQQNRSMRLGDLAVCHWHTPWIEGFDLPANDDLVIALHHRGQADVRAVSADAVSGTRSLPGAITCIPPERDHRFRVGGEVGFKTIHIPRALMRQVPSVEPIGLTPGFRFAFRDAFLGACIDALLGESSKPGLKTDAFIDSVTTSMLIHLRRSCTGDLDARPAAVPIVASPPIERARQMIDADLARGLTLEELADAVGISRSHFARLFRAEMGISPHRYQIYRRIEQAKRLLLDSSMELVDISMELGFCSQSHFTQVFNAHVGMPPRRFREQRFNGKCDIAVPLGGERRS